MLFQRKKILCFVLIYDQIPIIEKTLDFLTKYSNELEIIALENPSENSDKIKHLIEAYGKRGLLRSHYLFEKNITGAAYTEAVNDYTKRIQNDRYIMITDGDLFAQSDEWLDESKSILKRHRDVFVCGISLSRENLPLETFPSAKDWIPADIKENKDYYEALTGAHLLLFRGKEFVKFMQWKEQNNLQFVDGTMHKYCYEVIKKKWARTKRSTAYHLTWDLYSDVRHPYTLKKTNKSFQNTWYHDQSASYTITNY